MAQAMNSVSGKIIHWTKRILIWVEVKKQWAQNHSSCYGKRKNHPVNWASSCVGKSSDFESTCATLDYLIVKSGKKLTAILKLLPRIFLSLMTCPLKVRSILPGVNAINSAKTPTWELKPGSGTRRSLSRQYQRQRRTWLRLRICYSQFLARTAHSLACSTRQRKTGNARFTRQTPGITLLGLKNTGCYCPGCFPTKPACSTRWKFMSSQTGSWHWQSFPNHVSQTWDW